MGERLRDRLIEQLIGTNEPTKGEPVRIRVIGCISHLLLNSALLNVMTKGGMPSVAKRNAGWNEVK